MDNTEEVNEAVAIARIAQAEHKEVVIEDSIRTVKQLLHAALVKERHLEETLQRFKANHRFVGRT